MRNLTCHWLTSNLPGAKQGEVKRQRWPPAWKISFVSLVAYGPEVFLLSLSRGGVIASESRQGGSQQVTVRGRWDWGKMEAGEAGINGGGWR